MSRTDIRPTITMQSNHDWNVGNGSSRCQRWNAAAALTAIQNFMRGH